jgi:hypothetical protein
LRLTCSSFLVSLISFILLHVLRGTKYHVELVCLLFPAPISNSTIRPLSRLEWLLAPCILHSAFCILHSSQFPPQIAPRRPALRADPEHLIHVDLHHLPATLAKPEPMLDTLR